jgi:hypothetical protein
MNGPSLPRATPGSPYTARDQNRVVDEVERLGRLRVGQGLAASSGPHGTTISRDDPERIWAKITSVTSGAWAWTEQIATSGGGWTNGTRTGTATNDPAYEVNGATPGTVPMVVLMERAVETGVWVFQAGSC